MAGMTPNEPEGTGRPSPETQNGAPRMLAKIGWGIYQQVAAVLATFALGALVEQVFDVGWRGFLETLIGYWTEYVRPVVKWILDVIISTPLKWAFNWNFQTPLWFRDYLSVGVVYAFSNIRARRMSRHLRTGWQARMDIHMPALFNGLFWPVLFAVESILSLLNVLIDRLDVLIDRLIVLTNRRRVRMLPADTARAVPTATPAVVHAAVDASNEIFSVRYTNRVAILTALPLVYLGLLLAINYLILK